MPLLQLLLQLQLLHHWAEHMVSLLLQLLPLALIRFLRLLLMEVLCQ